MTDDRTFSEEMDDLLAQHAASEAMPLLKAFAIVVKCQEQIMTTLWNLEELLANAPDEPGAVH